MSSVQSANRTFTRFPINTCSPVVSEKRKESVKTPGLADGMLSEDVVMEEDI